MKPKHLLAVLAALAWHLMALAQPIVLDGRAAAAGEVPLAGHLELLRDPGGRMDIAQVVRAPGFAPLPGNLGAGYDVRSAFWLRFTVDRAAAAPHDWWLELGPSFLDAVTLYEPEGSGAYRERRLGDRQPFSQREIKHRNFVFPLVVPAEKAVTYYVRVQTTSVIILGGALWRPQAFAASTSIEYGWYGAFFGMAFLVSAFNLIFWIWLRDRIYLSYTFFSGGLAVTYVVINGFLVHFLFQDQPLVADQLVGVVVCAIYALGTWFFSTVMNIGRAYPRLQRVVNALIGLYVAAMFVSIAGYYYVVIALINVSGIMSTVVFLVLGFMMLRRGHRELALFQWSFAFHYVATVANALRNIGVISPGPFINNAPMIGAAAHMILFNIALAVRVRHAERAKFDAEHKAAAATREAERAGELALANAALETEIAERHRLQEKLQSAFDAERQALAVQRDFVATVSHEFRTPLAIIDAAAENLALQLGAAAPPGMSQRVDKIRGAADRLTELIDNCLADERLRETAGSARAEDVDLDALIRGVLDERPGAAAARLHYEPPAGSPPHYRGDRQLLAIAFSNLVDNAFKYSPQGGAVQVGLTRMEGAIVITVADAGIGIAAADQERIFERFCRAGAPAGVAGAGLGLYLVRQIVRMHGGDVGVTSAAGAGAEFRIVLPRPE